MATRKHTLLQVLHKTRGTIYRHYSLLPFWFSNTSVLLAVLGIQFKKKKKEVPSENSEFIFQCQNCQIILPLTLIPLKLFSLLPKHLRCRKRRQLQVFPETFPCSRAVYIPMNQYSITTLFHQHLSPFFLWHIKPHQNNLFQSAVAP